MLGSPPLRNGVESCRNTPNKIQFGLMLEFFKKLHFDRSDNIAVQFYRYLFVGGFAFVVDFAILFSFTEFFNIHYVISAAIAFIVGSVVNFRLSVKWIFHVRKIKNKTVEFWFFTGIGFCGLVMNTLIIYGVTHFLGVHYLLSKIISAGTIFSLNFYARKTLLFSLSKPKEQSSISS